MLDTHTTMVVFANINVHPWVLCFCYENKHFKSSPHVYIVSHESGSMRSHAKRKKKT